MAGGIAINQTTERLSAGITKYQPEIYNQVFKGLPLFEHIMDNKKTQDGGLEIGIRFEYNKQPGFAAAGGATAINGYEELPLTPSENVKTGTEPWYMMTEPVVISLKETRENSGQNGYDLMKQKTRNAENSFRDEFNKVFWGTAGGDQSLLPKPITKLITGANLGAGTTVHGLAKSSNTWMYSQEIASVGEFADNGIAKMRTLYNSCSANSPNKQDHPTIIMTDQSVFEAYEDQLPPQYRTDSLDKGDIGFQQLYFKGIPMRFDIECPLNTSDNKHQLFMLNKNYLYVVMDKELNFKTFPFEFLLPLRAVWATQIMTMLGLICVHFKSQGVMYGIDVNT